MEAINIPFQRSDFLETEYSVKQHTRSKIMQLTNNCNARKIQLRLSTDPQVSMRLNEVYKPLTPTHEGL
jgi:hypothetical protein